MNRRKHYLIAEGGWSGFDVGNQLWGIFVTGLGEMHLVAGPESGSFLAISRVEVIGRGEELSRGQSRLSPEAATLLAWLKLLLPHGAQGGDGRQRFHPVRSVGRLERLEQEPAISSHLIGVLLALLLLL